MAHPEHVLISSVLRTGNMAPVTAAGISPEWFHDYKNEWSFIQKYHQRHQKTPSKALYRQKFKGETILSVDDVEWAVEEVLQNHIEKALIESMMEANGELRDSVNPQRVLDDLHRSLVSLQSDIQGAGGEDEILSDWQSLYREVSARATRAEATGHPGIPTGFRTLDSLTGGIEPGELWIIAARAGIGKTWTMVRMACAALFAHHRVQYDTLEQTRNQIAMRVHAFMSAEYGKEVFPVHDCQRGIVNLPKYRAYLKDIGKSLDGALFVNDTSSGRVTPSTIATQIERNNPEVIYIDYIGLMGMGTGSAQRDQWQSLAQLSAELKGIAMRYEVGIVAASQINRVGNLPNRPPGVEHLSGSDAIGQDADAVVTMHRFSNHVVQMLLAKYRHGQDGVSWFTEFQPNTGNYSEISTDRAHEIREDDLIELER